MSVSRRAMLVLAAATWPLTAGADEAALDAAIREAIGEAVPEDGGVTLRLPPTAENGAQVPVTIFVESPMSASDHVTALHLFATRNPTPGIASFQLAPGLARAEVQTRIRLAEGQRIIALAQHSDGRVGRAIAETRVTSGGCLT